MTDYKDASGKIIGELLNTEFLGSGQNRYEISHVNLFNGIGEWVFSQYDIVDATRIKAIAEYKKIGIEGRIGELQDEIEEREEEIAQLKGRLGAIERGLSCVEKRIGNGE